MISEPHVRVRCDTMYCEEEEEYGMIRMARGWDITNVEAQIQREGWTIEDSLTYCPSCSQERKEAKEQADGNVEG